MPSKISILIILSIMLLTLSGCNDTVFPAHRISSDSADALEVAIAIDASGGKHVATIECPKDHPSPCELVYRYVTGFEAPNGIRITISPSFIIRYPDITVDDEGGVYLVWQLCETGYINCENYYGFGSKTGFQVLARLDPLRDSAGPPKLASRGPYVYAVYEVPDGAGSALRYRQLSPLDASSGWVSDHPGGSNINQSPSLAIAGNGTLFVAWRKLGAAGNQIYRNNNCGVTGDMPQLGEVQTSTNLSVPNMAIQSDDSHTLIVWTNKAPGANPSSHSIDFLWNAIDLGICDYSGSTGSFVLPSTQHWAVPNAPAITADSQSFYMAFNAANDGTGTAAYEIFNVRYQPAYSSHPTPEQISHNGMQNGQPFVELINGFEVIVWRTDGFPPAHGDIFWSAYPFTEINTVRQAQSMNGRDGADVDSNGTQMAGVWLEMHDSMYNELDQAWMTFNGYGTYLPLVVR